MTEYLAENGLIDDLAVELMSMLVPLNDPARGVDNAWMPNDTTPLMMAAALCRPDMMATLLQAGANPTLLAGDGADAVDAKVGGGCHMGMARI